jgi:hypothetical protein
MKSLMLAMLATAFATCASADTLQKNERQQQSVEPKQKEDCRKINTSKSNLREGFSIDQPGVKRQEPQQFTIDEKGVKREAQLPECEKQPEATRAVPAK